MKKIFFVRQANSIIPLVYCINFDEKKLKKEGMHSSIVGFYLRMICFAYNPFDVSKIVKELFDFLSDNEYDSFVSIKFTEIHSDNAAGYLTFLNSYMNTNNSNVLYDRGVFQGYGNCNKNFFQQYFFELPCVETIRNYSVPFIKKVFRK